jgi:hypothetical protein
MKWLQIVKVLLKHAKLIQKQLNIEKSSRDPDSPNVLTADELAITITEGLLDAVPELIKIMQRK